jgi:DNA-binding MarR family transcriptional regulator
MSAQTKPAPKREPAGRPARAARPAHATKAAPAVPVPEPAHKVLRRFRVVFNSVKSHFRAVESEAGVSGAQLWALSVIRQQPGLGVSDLARAMDVHQSTASNLLRSVVQAGLVHSAREEEDRRSVQLYLTPRGQKVLAKAPGPFEGILPDALRKLDAKALARLDRDLGKLIELLGPEVQEKKNEPMGH